MPFNDDAVAGDYLVRNAIKSPNYDPGVSGWAINADGSALFNQLDINVTDPTTGGSVASISPDGVGSFADLSVVGSPVIEGRDFETEWIDPLPRGIIGWGQTTSLSGSSTTEAALFEVSAAIEVGRTYDIAALVHLFTSVAGVFVALNIRYTTNGTTPTTGSTLLATQGVTCPVANSGQDVRFNLTVPTFTTAATYRFLVTMSRGASGTGTVNAFCSTTQVAWIAVTDQGPAIANGYAAAGTGGGGLVTYQTDYAALWSGSYNGANNLSTFGGSQLCYQGDIDANGPRKALIGFDWATIRSNLAGSTVNGCWITLYYQHWYFNAGGTALIGTHNLGVSSAPSTFFGTNTARVSSAGWPKPGQRQVTLGATIGAEFRDGVSNGICLGIASTAFTQTYYGYASGPGQPNPPVLTINYTK